MAEKPMSAAEAAKLAGIADQAQAAIDAAGLQSAEAYTGLYEAARKAIAFTDQPWILGGLETSPAYAQILEAVAPATRAFDSPEFQNVLGLGGVAPTSFMDQVLKDYTLGMGSTSWMTAAAKGATGVSPQVWESVAPALANMQPLHNLVDTEFAHAAAINSIGRAYSDVLAEAPAIANVFDAVQASIFDSLKVPSFLEGLDHVTTGLAGIEIPIPSYEGLTRVLELIDDGVYDTDAFDDFYDEAMNDPAWRDAIKTAGASIALKLKVSKKTGRKAAVVLLQVAFCSAVFVLALHVPEVSAALTAGGLGAPQMMTMLKGALAQRRSNVDGGSDPRDASSE